MNGFSQPGRAYVAYLDGNGELVNVYGIELWGGDLVAALAADARAHLDPRGGLTFHLQLVGEVAFLLHLAVTGRKAGESPEQADPRQAAMARAVLAAGVQQRQDYAAAYAAIADRDYIEPCYGVAVNAPGGGVLPAPRVTLDLPLVFTAEELIAC